MRKIKFANNEFYHIFNRGVDKREIFFSISDYERFLVAMCLLNNEEDGLMIDWRDYNKCNTKAKIGDFLKLRFRNKKQKLLVEILAYCLNPNHYHFILKQINDRGIERFLHKLGTSYTKYFNKKNKRNGSLFQGVFKSVHIDSNEYLLHLSAYVNKNNFIHKYHQDDKWPYSSLADYMEEKNDTLIKNKDIILGQFKNKQEYKKFLDENAMYLKQKKEIERYILED